MILSKASFTPWPDSPQIEAYFFTKLIDFGSLKSLFPSSEIKNLKQIHSSKIIEVKKASEPLDDADGFVTKLSDVALTVHTADCLPLLGFSSEVIGACHGGWRGVANGVIENWIARFCSLGAAKDEIHVAIGPAIGPCHFEVGQEVAAQLVTGIPEKLLKTISLPHEYKDKRYISLRELARYKLLKLGLKESNLNISEECTFCNPALYHSYRRDGAQKGQRLEAVIVKGRH